MAGTSSVSGIVSGLDTNDIITKLMQIERKPLVRLQAKKNAATTQLTAWQGMAARLVTLKINATVLNRELTFAQRTAVSSDLSAVSVSVGGVPDAGTYSFTVQRLASASQVLSRGYSSRNTPIMPGGTITVKAGNNTADQDVNGYTSLAFLNNGAGIGTGSMRITDRNGNSALFSFTNDQTIQDVLDRINNTTSIAVRASINDTGTGIQLRDISGGTGLFMVEEAGGTMAASLGIRSSVNASQIVGGDLDPAYRITIDDSNNTLEGIRDEINALNGPFYASIINTGSGANPFKLSLSSVRTGAIGTLTISGTRDQVVDELVGIGDGTKGAVAGDYSLGYGSLDDIADVSSLTVGGVAFTVRGVGQRTGSGSEVEVDIATGALQFFSDGVAVHVADGQEIRATYTPSGMHLDNVIQEAQDALILLGGTNPEVISRPTNVVNDLIPGLTLTLLKAGPTPVTVDVKTDIDGIKKNIKDFIETVNGILTEIRTQNTYDPDTKKKGGPLFGDVMLMNIENQLLSSLTRTVPGVSSSFNSIFQLGVRVDVSGTFSVDDTELTRVLTYHLEDVKRLFTATANIALTPGAVVSSGSATAEGSLAALNDGVISSENWPAGGWTSAQELGTDYLTLSFAYPRQINKVVLRTIDSITYPAASYGIRSYALQYLKQGADPQVDASWVTTHTVADNTRGVMTHFLSGKPTDRIRVKITGTNAPDNRARMVELEAYSDTGIAGNAINTLASITDAGFGLIPTVTESIQAELRYLSGLETELETRMAQREERLRAQFLAMESALGKMQSTSAWLSSQLTNLSRNWGTGK